MKKRILIIGGAGFIGSHLADELLAHGYAVRVFDNLDAQVHGATADGPPDYLSDEVEFVRGDVRDRKAVSAALRGVDAVYHFAALVGVGQSMYEISRYMDVNNMGTGVLLEALIEHPVEKVVVASSMSIYGEGLYRDKNGKVRAGTERSLDQLKAGKWELSDEAGEQLTPVPTPESKMPSLPSIYALTKYDQEQACLKIGAAYKIPTVGLRFFNVFGTRQSLQNPYTGVLAIFAARYLNGKAPLINEDGNQRRDFVSVHDIAQACRLAMEVPGAAGQAFNVGSGQSYSVLEVADLLAQAMGKEHLRPQLTGRYRAGDIRHCFADIGAARKVLGYEPKHLLENSIESFADWLREQEDNVPPDRVEEARAELVSRGLSV